MALTIDGAADELQAAEKIKSDLEAIGATLTTQIAALHADVTRTPEYRDQVEREMREAAQTRAAALLAERETLQRLERAARAETYHSREAIVRRTPLTDGKDPTREALERLNWRMELPHLNVDELEDVYTEAELDGQLWLQRQALRELQRRATGDNAAAVAPIVRRVAERFARVEIPAAQRAADVFGKLKRVKREVENAYSGLARPVSPTARLQAARAGGGR